MAKPSQSHLTAKRPAQFNLRVWWKVAGRVMAAADTNNVGLVAAGVAFYSLLSIFPAFAALIALWGYFADPAMLRDQMGVAERLLPAGAFSILSEQVRALIATNKSTLQLTSLVSLALAIWTARNGVAAMIRGLNSIYSQSHRANLITRYAIAILLTVILIIVSVFAFAAVVVLPPVMAFLPLGGLAQVAIAAVKWVVVLAVVFFGICLLYRYGPNRRAARVPWITAGAVIALLVWALGSAAFSIYLRNFGSFNEVYGSLGAVVALLFWLYISAYVVLMGAQLNAELELVTAADTTVGESLPGGQRKAFVADHARDETGAAQPVGTLLPSEDDATGPQDDDGSAGTTRPR